MYLLYSTDPPKISICSPDF